MFTVAFNALIACALEKPIPWIISTASSFGVKESEDTLDDVDDDDGSSKSSAKSFKKCNNITMCQVEAKARL